MNELKSLTKQFIMVGINEIKISSNEYPIIGTQGLAPCISFMLYNKKLKKSIVGHLSTDNFLTEQSIINIILKIQYLIKENNLKNNNFDLYLIPGSIPSKQKIYSYDLEIINTYNIKEYKTIELLEEIIKNIKAIKINKIIKDIPNDAFQIVDLKGNLTDNNNPESSKQYAFDTRTGKFITNKVLFGLDYLEINKKQKKL